MIRRHPLMNKYWEDKRAKVEDIKCPAYVVASFSNGLHTAGTFRGFEGIQHQNKWYVTKLLPLLCLREI